MAVSGMLPPTHSGKMGGDGFRLGKIENVIPSVAANFHPGTPGYSWYFGMNARCGNGRIPEIKTGRHHRGNPEVVKDPKTANYYMIASYASQ